MALISGIQVALSVRSILDDRQDAAANFGAEQVAQVETDVIEFRCELELLLIVAQQILVVDHGVDEIAK